MNDLLALRTEPLPSVLWIELTSRCPFDCVFCTRKSLRGAGQHMDFALYQRLIGELRQPRILRLNYAGESGHYPQLAEAIRLAAATGAEVELVSALASLKPERIEAMLEAGLNRLTVSLHSLDADSFSAIYRFGTLSAMRERLHQVAAWRDRSARRFTLDLAFVAMQRNLAELPAIAALAADLGIGVLAVHPLIGRDPLPLGTPEEHDADGGLTASFKHQLAASVDEARQRAPSVQLQLSSYELAGDCRLDHNARPWPGRLPKGALIAGCDQSPFSTTHVLSDGRVVACEVTETRELGSLQQQSLHSIWHGERYQAFRRQHRAGEHPACQTCIYKQASKPSALRSRITAASAAEAQLPRGWHARDGGNTLWSSGRANLVLARPRRLRRLRLRGQLAAAAVRSGFELRLDGALIHRQAAGLSASIDLDLPVHSPHQRPYCLLEIDCGDLPSPHQLGEGDDQRSLGLALFEAELR